MQKVFFVNRDETTIVHLSLSVSFMASLRPVVIIFRINIFNILRLEMIWESRDDTRTDVEYFMYQSLYIPILITGPPSITVPTQEYQLAPGTDMNLACTVQASPVATVVYWKKNGVTISPGSGVTLASPSLTISNADESDLGIYECCAENTFNTVTRVCGEDTIMVKGSKHNIDCSFVFRKAKPSWLDKYIC